MRHFGGVDGGAAIAHGYDHDSMLWALNIQISALLMVYFWVRVHGCFGQGCLPMQPTQPLEAILNAQSLDHKRQARALQVTCSWREFMWCLLRLWTFAAR